MDFKTYCQELKEKTAGKHEKIIFDLCILLKNCADCHECNSDCNLSRMIYLLNLCKITEKSFRLPDQWDIKINRKFIDITAKNGYQVSFIEINKQEYYTQFELK